MRRLRSILIVVAVLGVSLSAKDLLIVDTSGSVTSHAQEVTEMVRSYLKTHQNVLAFSSKPYFVKSEKDLQFGGSTALSLALDEIEPIGRNFYITIVTDGEPDNNLEAIKAAHKLRKSGVKICAVYVSNNHNVPEVLNAIADKTFSVNQFSKAIYECSAIKDELIGVEAVHKHVDINKYQF